MLNTLWKNAAATENPASTSATAFDLFEEIAKKLDALTLLGHLGALSWGGGRCGLRRDRPRLGTSFRAREALALTSPSMTGAWVCKAFAQGLGLIRAHRGRSCYLTLKPTENEGEHYRK